MERLKKVLEEQLNIDFLGAVLSGSRKKEVAEKQKIRPLQQKGEFCFQIETFRNRQAFHRNLSKEEAIREILETMQYMKQMQIDTRQCRITVLAGKKGTLTIKKKEMAQQKEVSLEHNRKKRYILEEGVPVPFLKDLQVMTEEGKVIRSRMDKFRQINRYLEFVEDILPALHKEREVTILDFGCGKSYLSFAMYYYLREKMQYDVRIIGLDLKKEVIDHCNRLARSYGYEKLHFQHGNIADYVGEKKIDMVVSLHACDTATDFALQKAVEWGADVILAVPCCQHELNGQIQSKILAPVLKYGLIKERIAALVTDALRAEHLEACGYEAQILEFIDMEHTPKNILIRAVRKEKGTKDERVEKALRECQEALHVTPSISRLLKERQKSI